MEDEKKPVASKAKADEPVVARRSVNRGNARRLMRASDAFRKAAKAFHAEMDGLVYLVDSRGDRVGKWPLVEAVDELSQAVEAEINRLVNWGK